MARTIKTKAGAMSPMLGRVKGGKVPRKKTVATRAAVTKPTRGGTKARYMPPLPPLARRNGKDVVRKPGCKSNSLYLPYLFDLTRKCSSYRPKGNTVLSEEHRFLDA